MSKFKNQFNLSEFLSVSKQFSLGMLPTETPHPRTKRLAEYSTDDLAKGIDLIKGLDIELFDVLFNNSELLLQLNQDVYRTFKNGCKVFLCGCGSTGRLSLVLETLWRQKHREDNSVISFMAGGDTALIKSIEDFEDHPEFGERQLQELGFQDGDLLISCTEGGETPFVIGATEVASKISKNKPYFLYCNPDELLIGHVERSRRVIENRSIKKINLYVGPMALSGSTRMQASTILMLAVGYGLLDQIDSMKELVERIEDNKKFIMKTDFSFLKKFIEIESQVYSDNENVFYSTDQTLGISILTDTTERSPTFSLLPFENVDDSKQTKKSMCYLLLDDAANQVEAWKMLLAREPRALDWHQYADRIDMNRLMGYDFSRNVRGHRQTLCNHDFSILFENDQINFDFAGIHHSISCQGQNELMVHTILKLMLNIHSTLVMGRLGRYQDNIMIWVRPSNYKLIDRSIRYIDYLLSRAGVKRSYQEIAHECHRQMEMLTENDSIVLHTVESLKKDFK